MRSCSNQVEVLLWLSHFLLEKLKYLLACVPVLNTMTYLNRCLIIETGDWSTILHSTNSYIPVRLAFHSKFAANTTNESVSVITDNTDVYILLLRIAPSCDATLYFRQANKSSKAGITYHNVTALANKLEDRILQHPPKLSCINRFRFHKDVLPKIEDSKFQEADSTS